MSDYYNILGVNKNSSESEIKKAYKKMCMKYHPDRNQGNKEEAEEKFKKIAQAYKVLSDSELKRKYDLYGEEGLNDNGVDMSNINPFDIFSNFTSMFDGMRGQRQEEKIKSPTRQEELKLPLEDLYTGKSIKINYRKKIKCVNCNGLGCENVNDIVQCELCEGKGSILKIRRLGPMIQQMSTQCYKCAGKGSIIKLGCECTKCNGTKYNEIIHTLQVNIKIGTKNGDRLVFYNEGDWDTEYKEPGDLHLIVKETKSSNGMVREGENLILKMKISLYDSLCGLNKIIKHLDGRNVLLKYEKVINPYTKMFIENEGMIDVNGTIGDLIIEFAIQFPEEIEEKRLQYLKKILVKPERQIWDVEPSECKDYQEYELKNYENNYNNYSEEENENKNTSRNFSNFEDNEGVECIQQ